MRRIAPVLAATAGGLALLANFHTSAGSGTSTAVAGAPTPGAPAAAGNQTTPDRSTAAPVARTIDGPAVATKYGNVQVRVTVDGTTLADVQAVTLPSEKPKSQTLSAQAGPLLRQEALQAQSATIDAVSGASYTSAGYRQSLQGALDQAKQ